MGTTRTVILAILAISFFTFVAFFGRLPGLRATPIGYLHRIIWITIPNSLSRLDKAVTNGRVAGSVSRTWNTLLYEKHPTVLYFFLGLVTGGAVLLVPSTWQHLSFIQNLLTLVLLPLPYIFTRLCNISTPDSPHIITQTNFLHHLVAYPYDYKLFHPGRMCRTCQIPKPARSKHCSLCKACVARSDHHCIWINNCVGRGNYKHFLALLLSTTVLLSHGAYLAYSTLKPEVAHHFKQYPYWHELEFAGRTDFTGRMLCKGESLLDVLATAFLIGGVSRGGVGFLALLTAPLPFGLLAYHVYLIWAGATTNESGKWSDWKEDMHDGLCFITDMDAGQSYAHGSADAVWGGYDPNLWKRSAWPKRSSQFLVLTQDGQYPRNLPAEIMALVGDAEWRRVWNLKEVKNIYDLGFWGNFMDMLTN